MTWIDKNIVSPHKVFIWTEIRFPKYINEFWKIYSTISIQHSYWDYFGRLDLLSIAQFTKCFWKKDRNTILPKFTCKTIFKTSLKFIFIIHNYFYSRLSNRHLFRLNKFDFLEPSFSCDKNTQLKYSYSIVLWRQCPWSCL